MPGFSNSYRSSKPTDDGDDEPPLGKNHVREASGAPMISALPTVPTVKRSEATTRPDRAETAVLSWALRRTYR